MLRTALAFTLAISILTASAKAQEEGIIDTISMIATITPNAQASLLKLKLELWVFNDEPLVAANVGFGWDNPNLNLDSAVGTTLTTTGFQIGPFFYENNDIATTNANNRFLFGGVAISPMFTANASGRRLWASYYFTLSSWVNTDVINIDTLFFNEASVYQLVPALQVPIIPVWTGGLTIIDPNAPSNLILSKDSLHFSTIQGGPAPAFQEFNISSSTGATVPFTLNENAPWLLVSPINSSTPRTIRVEINNIGLAAGAYIDTIVVNSNDAANTPLDVVVTLSVTPPPPTIAYAPASFFFNALANDTNPDPKILTIENSGGSVLNWTVSKTQSWLNLTPTIGSDSNDVAVAVDITGLPLGTFFDTITISAAGATNTPRKVPVTLTVASDLPVLVVDSLFNYVVIQTGLGVWDSTYFTIRNGGAGNMDFWFESTSPRIREFDPDSGTAPATVKMLLRSVSPADYIDTVWVYSNQAINSPVPVVFHLHYVQNPAVMSVTPFSLDYTLYECSQGLTGIPPVLSFTVENSGADDPMLFDIVYESELFTVSPISGSAFSYIEVATIDPKLPVGVYKDTIYIYAQKALNNTYKLEVTLNVIAATTAPQIFIMDSNYIMTAQEDHGPIIPIYFTIQNRFGGCLDWHIDNDIPWSIVLDTVGNGPDTIGIFASAFGLTFGQYIDSFLISSPVASNSPRRVKLTFKVWKFHGDNNYDGRLNILDLVYLIDYFFRGSGIQPVPERNVGDVNCDERLNIVDMTVLIDYFFRHGPPPCGNPSKK